MAFREISDPAPVRPVRITNGERVMEFDTPADFVDFLAQHPEFHLESHLWDWDTNLVTSDS